MEKTMRQPSDTFAVAALLALAGGFLDAYTYLCRGGVFANVLLQERCRALLEADGFSVYVNEQVPGNDGGICLGQAWIALQD